MASVTTSTPCCIHSQHPTKSLFFFSLHRVHFSFSSHSATRISTLISTSSSTRYRFIKANAVVSTRRFNCFSSCKFFSNLSANTTNYEFADSSSEVELRLQLGKQELSTSRDIFVDADGTSLTVRIKRHGSLITLLQTNQLFEKIKPAETIWYLDDDQLVISLKKQDPDLKWPGIMESWESLTAGSTQLLKGTSIYIVGDSTQVNQKVAQELAVGLGYTPLDTKELLESFTKQTIDSCTQRWDDLIENVTK